jgi:hypothetical protein
MNENLKYILDAEGSLIGDLIIHQSALFPTLQLDSCSWNELDVTVFVQM